VDKNRTKRLTPARVTDAKQLAVDVCLAIVGCVAAVVGGCYAIAWFYGVGILAMLALAWRRRWGTRLLAKWRQRDTKPATPQADSGASTSASGARRSRAGNDDSLVDRMLAGARYALLLRSQVVDNLTEEQLRQTVRELQSRMALVPKGHVILGQTDHGSMDGPVHDDLAPARGRVVEVEPVLIDRYAVSNEQFQRFVDGGGYEEMAIWDQAILPAMLDFVDSSGHPGPRTWEDGHYLPGQEDHPVVGVCWYEASAYAHWVGKRLPSDAEWCKAACWPVSVAADSWVQRKFPWGNAMESQRANIWGFGDDRPAPVDAYQEGMSVGGIYQLIGNVWEWTSGPFGRVDDASLLLSVPMRSIRGGAFDTYFENEATCQYQSGDNTLGRKHNIGIRLALGACDLAPQAADLLLAGVLPQEADEPAEEEVTV
jgi:iron(II)-dependent oxidoreductase